MLVLLVVLELVDVVEVEVLVDVDVEVEVVLKLYPSQLFPEYLYHACSLVL